jgi:hypothetical protein
LSSRWILFLLFVIALSIRLCAAEWMGEPPQKDALQYHQIAVNIVSGNGYSLDGVEPTTLRPPVYPLFIAAIYALSGVDHKNTLIAQAVLNALLLIPLFWLAVKVSKSVAVGMTTAVLFVLHTSFEIVTRLTAENLLIPLMLGLVVLMLRAGEAGTHHLKYGMGAGLMVGVMGLTKPEYSLLGIGILFMALIWSQARQNWRTWLIVALVSLALQGAWQLRNIEVKNPGQQQAVKSTLLFANCPALFGNGWWTVSDMKKLEEQRIDCHRMLESQPNDTLMNRIEALWYEQPWLMIKLSVSRELILWASPPVGSSKLGTFAGPLQWLALMIQYLFVGAAFWMLIRELRKRPELFPFLALALYMTVVYGFTHSIRRYGYPFVPELCLFAAWWMGMLWWKWSSRMMDGESHGSS